MSRFEQEFALVPTAARVVAGLAYLALVAVMAAIWLAPPLLAGESPHPMLWIWFFVTTVPALMLPAFVLLVGYVCADARRRGMNHVLWTLLAIFVPNAIGLLLYFILRAPLPVPCPSCGTPVGKDLAHCPRCGAGVRWVCPQCQRPANAGWTHCGHCGAALAGSGGVNGK